MVRLSVGLPLCLFMAVARGEDSLKDRFSKQTYTSESGEKLLYRLAEPSEAIQKHEKLPLVLFLHGAGERGCDNEAQLKHGVTELIRDDRREMYPCFVVVPQCPQDFKWVDVDWSLPPGHREFSETPSTTLKLVFELLDQMIAGGKVDENRIYVTGLSMGGYGSWFAAGIQPQRFAAMLAICGGGDAKWAGRYDGLSVWAVHGDADSVVPVEGSRDMIAELVRSGHRGELRYTELRGVGHDCWSETYSRSDIWQWLFDQSR